MQSFKRRLAEVTMGRQLQRDDIGICIWLSSCCRSRCRHCLIWP